MTHIRHSKRTPLFSSSFNKNNLGSHFSSHSAVSHWACSFFLGVHILLLCLSLLSCWASLIVAAVIISSHNFWFLVCSSKQNIGRIMVQQQSRILVPWLWCFNGMATAVLRYFPAISLFFAGKPVMAFIHHILWHQACSEWRMFSYYNHVHTPWFKSYKYPPKKHTILISDNIKACY